MTNYPEPQVGVVVVISRDVHFETIVRDGCAQSGIVPSVVKWCGEEVETILESTLALQPDLALIQNYPGEYPTSKRLADELEKRGAIDACILGSDLLKKVGAGKRSFEYIYPTKAEVEGMVRRGHFRGQAIARHAGAGI